jgi:adenylyltransferase/sulfurtransferase
VSPAAELSIDEVRRYSRHLIIPDVAMDGQKRLKNARVLGRRRRRPRQPDADVPRGRRCRARSASSTSTSVDESNLQRQVIHGQSDIGRSKAQSAKARCRRSTR